MDNPFCCPSCVEWRAGPESACLSSAEVLLMLLGLLCGMCILHGLTRFSQSFETQAQCHPPPPPPREDFLIPALWAHSCHGLFILCYPFTSLPPEGETVLALSGLPLFPAHSPVLSTQKVLKICSLEEMASFLWSRGRAWWVKLSFPLWLLFQQRITVQQGF